MKITGFCMIGCMSLLIGCSRQTNSDAKEASVSSANKSVNAFKDVRLVNTNDLVCGMSLTAGVGDTAHYQGKVFGFCSTGCKNKFSMSPAQYFAAQ